MPESVFSVGPNRADIAFIDSGAPVNQDAYTTLLIVHGFLWNGGVFKKVIDNATAHNIRAIAINRRGYKDSTPFTPHELAPLVAEGRTLEDSNKFMKGQAVELADFIKHLIDNNMVSRRHQGQGCITLLGWSLGNAYIIDFLSHVPALPNELSTLMKEYLSGYIVFDPPFEALSLPPPDAGYFGRREETARNSDPTEAVKAMADYVAGYFEFPPLASHLGLDVLTWSDADKEARYGASQDKPTGKSTRVIEEESGRGTDFMASNEPGAIGTEMTITLKPLMGGELRSATEAILYEDPQKTLWPGMCVEYAYCTNSCTTCVYAGEAARARFEKAVANRKVKAITKANHFLPWVEPERFLSEMVTLM